jgi:F-type H+-transporting ATPase subunit a
MNLVASRAVLQSPITVGDHITFKLFGLTFNGDTLWCSGGAALIILGLGFYLRATISDGVPSKLQLVFESVVDAVNKQVEESMGIQVAPFVVPLAVTLFLFILTANWLAVIPSGHHPEYLPAATADVNLTYALALFVIGLVHITGIRKRGIKGYFAHYLQPFPFFLPINVIEEVAKPLTLALRLFGNLFAGGIMVLLISRLPVYAVPFGDVIWKLFDMFIGLIQAFIFSLLTVLYFGAATAGAEDHGTGHHADPATDPIPVGLGV